LFRNGEGIIDLDTEVPDSAFDLGVTEQELHGAQIAGTSVDQGLDEIDAGERHMRSFGDPLQRTGRL
jgi:hypothetical protein